MLKAYRYRIYPNREQAEKLNQTFGACRFIYNLALETKRYAWEAHRKNITAYDLHKQLTDLKKDCEWLQVVSRDALEKSILNLDKSYKSFFRGGGYPKFKKKFSKQSFRTRQALKVNWNENTITIEKIKNIPAVLSREFNGQIRQATISKTPTGKYFISILVQNGKEIPAKPEVKNALGIDLGLKHFAVTSAGEKFDNPKHLRNSLQRLKVLQRRASRKINGSSNRRKANLKVAILHEKISNQRQDFLHKLSSKLIYDSQVDTICIEGLRVHNMLQNHKLAQSIQDASWSEFFRQLNYKAEWRGMNVIQIGKFEPSSKMCSSCGAINSELTLADREWICKCGATHDRDLNAAINIKNIALSGKGIPVELAESSAIAGTMKQECLIN